MNLGSIDPDNAAVIEPKVEEQRGHRCRVGDLEALPQVQAAVGAAHVWQRSVAREPGTVLVEEGGVARGPRLIVELRSPPRAGLAGRGFRDSLEVPPRRCFRKNGSTEGGHWEKECRGKHCQRSRGAALGTT